MANFFKSIIKTILITKIVDIAIDNSKILGKKLFFLKMKKEA